jgi:hypothetical protein
MNFLEILEKLDLTPEKKDKWQQIYDMLNDEGKAFLEQQFEEEINKSGL